MPIRKALSTVVILRDKLRVEVRPGDEFDFTAEELSHIPKGALSTTGTVDLSAEDDAAAQPAAKVVTPAKPTKGATKTPAADTSSDGL